MAFDLATAKPYSGGFDLSTARRVETDQQPFDYRTFAIEEAQRQGVNPDDILTMIKVESSGNGKAISPKGAIGYMQLMPGTAKDLGVDPNDPKQNISGGIKYYKQMLDRFGGNRELALAAYNAGPGAVERAGGVPNYKETREYIGKIAPKTEADYLREELKKGDWLSRNLAGAGGAMVEGWEGLKDIFGYGDQSTIEAARVAQQEAPVGGILGSVAMMAPTMAIPGVNTVRGAAAVGGLYNALVTPGSIEDRKNATTMGILGGGAGQGVSNALGRTFSPNPTMQNALAQQGITLTPGQHAGGIFKNLEDKATSIPFLGEVINTARKRGIGEFNEAAISRAKIPGVNVDGIGNKALQDLRVGLGDAFDEIASRATIPGPDQQFLQNMVSLGQMANSLPPQEFKVFRETIQRELVERMGPNGQLNGDNIRAAIAGIRDRASRFSSSTDAWQRDLGDALNQASKEVSGLMERTNPQLSRELSEVNKAYAHFKVLQKAAGGVGAEEGVFTPAQLHRAARAADRSKDNRAFSEGTALYQDLTAAGKSIMPNKVPDSGTAGRLASNLFSLKGLAGLTGGGAAAIPALAIYSKTGSRATNALYDAIANSGNPNALRLIMNPVLTGQLE